MNGVDDERLHAHLRESLGAWPPPPGGVLVTTSAARTTPGWDGEVRRFARGRDYMLGREGVSTWLVIRARPGDTIQIISPPS